MNLEVIVRRIVFPALALVFVTAAPAAAQTWTGSSNQDDLRYRLDVLDAELADIRARLGGTVGSVAGTGGGTAGGTGAGGAQVAALEAEIRRLTAAVEEMQNRIRVISDDATRRFGDIEFRLNELEGNPTGGNVQPLGGGVALQSGGGGGAPSVAVAEQGDLDRAADDVRQGRFDQAEDRLRRFLSDYPSSTLSGDAWFWMGESQFVRGSHADAARSFLNGYNSNRAGPRAPHNLFKLGVTLGRLGQFSEACLTLREVPRQFPGAPENLVGRANDEAATLGCG